MPVIRENSLLININKDPDKILTSLEELCRQGIKPYIAQEPFYAYVEMGGRILPTVFPPLTLITIESPPAYNSNSPEHYRIVKPVWVNTFIADPCFLSRILERLLVEKTFEITVYDARAKIRVEECSSSCRGLRILSGIHRHNHSWLTGRSLFYEGEYAEALKQAIAEYAEGLKQVIATGDSNIIMAYNDNNGRPVLLFHVNMECRRRNLLLITGVLVDFLSIIKRG